jgi:hypothetical protein
MQHFFDMPDVLTLVFEKLDFKDARKFPLLSKAAHDAVNWHDLLERRTVRFEPGCVAAYLVRGSGWINRVEKAHVFKKNKWMQIAMVNNKMQRKIYLRHVGPLAIEAIRFDSASIGWKGRDFTAQDRFISREHDQYMENVNDYWFRNS